VPSDVEVMVVSYNSAAVLGRCLASIRTSIPGAAVAIREHGTEAGASDELHTIADRFGGRVRVEFDPTNPGFGAGCNALAATSTADVFLFLNPDAEVITWPWVSSDPPPATIIGPEMVDSGDPSRHFGVDFRVRDEIRRSWLRRRGARPTGTGFVSGAALLVGRDAFARIGGFDEDYFLFYEDIDLCLRANEVGISTTVDKRWTVRHLGAHSTSTRFGTSLLWSYESACRFHGRRGSPVWAYRLYVVADSAMRSTVHAVGRDRHRARGYATLGRRAAIDLIRRERPDRSRSAGRDRPSG
jgi:GT2 family glycosyltransferase